MKKVPRGFAPDHPRAGLLKHTALFAHHDGKHPAALKSGAIVDWCVDKWRDALPIVKWLSAHVVPHVS